MCFKKQVYIFHIKMLLSIPILYCPSPRDITYPRNIISCFQEDQGCQWDPLSMRQRNLSSQLESGRGLYSVDLKGHYGCVNAIAFSRNGEEFLASGEH